MWLDFHCVKMMASGKLVLEEDISEVTGSEDGAALAVSAAADRWRWRPFPFSGFPRVASSVHPHIQTNRSLLWSLSSFISVGCDFLFCFIV